MAKADALFDWGWLRTPALVRMMSPLNERECLLRLLHSVHCEPLAGPGEEVVGAVTNGSARLRRRHVHMALSRAVDAAPCVDVSFAAAAAGTSLDCLCFIGGPTLVYMALPFVFAVLVFGWALWDGFAHPSLWFGVVAPSAYGAFAATSLKSQAAGDVRFVLDFLARLLAAQPIVDEAMA